MRKIIEFLKNKKTYIIGAAMFVVAGLHAVKAQIPVLANIPDESWQAVMDFLKTGGVGLGLVALRLGVAKL